MISRSSPRGSALDVGRQQQQRAGVGLRPFGQAGQRQVGHRGHVGRLGQLEGQPAQLGRGPADLRDAVLFLFARAGTRNFVCPRRWVIVVGSARRQHVGRIVRGDRRPVGGRRRRRAGGPPSSHRRRRRTRRRSLWTNTNCVWPMRMMSPGFSGQSPRTISCAHHRAVAAFQVAQGPLPARQEHLDVVPAATLVLDHDLVGRRTADGDRLAGHQPEHVAPLRSFANHQIRELRHERSPRGSNFASNFGNASPSSLQPRRIAAMRRNCRDTVPCPTSCSKIVHL